MPEQLSLVAVPAPRSTARARRSGPAADRPVAERRPVARVVVDVAHAHLDRPFEYLVPAELDEEARPGVRVRVRFSGRDHDGYLIERVDEPEHTGRLAPLRRVVSAEPVLSPEVLATARAVADHYGGTLADVLRLAIPPRHARAERSVPAGDPPALPVAAGDGTEPGPWERYPAGPALLRRLRAGEGPAAAWLALPCQEPSQDWPAAIATAVASVLSSGRGAVVVVPDHRDVDRVASAVEAVVGEEVCARLTADLGPEARYRSFLRLSRGLARVAVGTRSAAWAPVVDPGLFVCWDDGDDLHQEPRAPYPHVRQILLERSRCHGAALLMGGYVRTVEVEHWVGEGVLAPVSPRRDLLAAQAPGVVVAGEGWQERDDPAARSARMPTSALRALRAGLAHGPVLVQVPRQGYVVAVSCAECRTPARCSQCSGPLGIPAGGRSPTCRWCGRGAGSVQACAQCGADRLRATAVGAERTVEELGKAFPGVRLVSSGGAHVVAEVPDDPAVVVATPGAEPVAERGYSAVVLLDGWRLLERPSLDSGMESLRRWAAAAALAGDRAKGRAAGAVVLCGVPPHAGVPAVEALVRWDPVGLAERECAERRQLGLPPLRRHAMLRGPRAGVLDFAQELAEAGHLVLGDPVVAPDDSVRAVVREGTEAAHGLAASVAAVRAVRSARKEEELVRAQLDVADTET